MTDEERELLLMVARMLLRTGPELMGLQDPMKRKALVVAIQKVQARELEADNVALGTARPTTAR